MSIDAAEPHRCFLSKLAIQIIIIVPGETFLTMDVWCYGYQNKALSYIPHNLWFAWFFITDDSESCSSSCLLVHPELPKLMLQQPFKAESLPTPFTNKVKGLTNQLSQYSNTFHSWFLWPSVSQRVIFVAIFFSPRPAAAMQNFSLVIKLISIVYQL